MCEKCRQRDMAVEPVEDTRRRQVCTTCAHVKRRTHKAWKQRTKDSYDAPHTGNKMWEKMSPLVRYGVELQFKLLREWMQTSEPKPIEIEAEYRRIVAEEGWVTAIDGELNVHYKNWVRRQKNN